MQSDYIALPQRVKRKSWRTHYSFLILFYFNVFTAGVSFALVLPSIWLYIQDNEGEHSFLAIVLSIYSVGEVIGSMFFGILSDYLGTKVSLISALAIGLLGSIMYFSADYLSGNVVLYVIMLARLLQGIWSGGQQASQQAYISEVVSATSKLKALSELGIANICGYILGPVFGMIVNFIDISIFIDVQVDSYTYPGYFQAFVSLVMIIINYFLFKELPFSERPERGQLPSANYSKPDRIGVVYCCVACFVIFYGFTVQETITSPLVTDHTNKFTESFGWSLFLTYLLFAGAGLISILSLAIVNWLDNKLSDRGIFLLSLVLGIFGWAMMIDYKEREIPIWLFLWGFGLISCHFAMARNVLFSIYSKIIGPHPAGLYMGMTLASGLLSRTISPFSAIKSLEVSLKLVMLINVGLLVVICVALLFYWDHLSPHIDNSKSDLIQFTEKKKKKRKNKLSYMGVNMPITSL